MVKCYELIGNLEKHIDTMKLKAQMEDDSDDYDKKVKLLNQALTAAYTKLEKFSA